MARPVEVIFPPIRSDTRRKQIVRAIAAVAVAFAAHALLWLVAVRSEASLAAWSANIALQVHHALSVRSLTEIETPPPLADAPKPKPKAKAADPNIESQPAGETPHLAQAGEIVAQDVAPDQPADLTENTVVSGSATMYSGGVTAATGTSATPVDPHAVHSSADSDRAERDASQSVRLSANEWRCPWPDEALSQEIYEQSVVLRVIVRVDGTVESAEIIEDPGHGFGAAALACARQTRFDPATNAAGEAIQSTSPPIRVRFTR